MWEFQPSMRGAIVLLLSMAVCACSAPLGLGQPSSRALEQGAADSLSSTSSYEITGSYVDQGIRWAIDLQMTHSGAMHGMFNAGGTEQLEVIVVGGAAYFRGQRFLASHVGSDLISQNLAAAAGSSWWKSAAVSVPSMPDIFDGAAFRTAFLGSAVSRRTDHVAVDGIDSVELSGQRGDVYIAEATPHRLVRLQMSHGVVVDGAGEADFHYGSYDRSIDITAPANVIDFSNLSTLPPVYTVVSVDTSRCGSPCMVSAQLKNLGGATGARAPSTVTFTMTEAASGATIGHCTAVISIDVGYNGTTSAGCSISNITGEQSAATVTAVATNPGHA